MIDLSGLLDRAVQLLFRLHRALWQQLESSLEPEQHTVSALQQSVVKLPRDPCALADTRVRASSRTDDATAGRAIGSPPTAAPERKSRRARGTNSSGSKPERWRNPAWQGYRSRRRHCCTPSRERILPWRQVGVESLAACARVFPITVKAVEPIAKLHLLRNQESGRSVVDLQVARVRGQRESSAAANSFRSTTTDSTYATSGKAGCDNSRRLQHLHDNSAGKPDTPIRRVCG